MIITPVAFIGELKMPSSKKISVTTDDLRARWLDLPNDERQTGLHALDRAVQAAEVRQYEREFGHPLPRERSATRKAARL